jgi:hypothetical protein
MIPETSTGRFETPLSCLVFQFGIVTIPEPSTGLEGLVGQWPYHWVYRSRRVFHCRKKLLAWTA